MLFALLVASCGFWLALLILGMNEAYGWRYGLISGLTTTPVLFGLVYLGLSIRANMTRDTTAQTGPNR